VNVDRRRLGIQLRICIPLAGLVLAAAGCLLLGHSSRPGQTAASQFAASPLAQALPSADAGNTSDARSLLAQLPLIFEPNQGQASLTPADPSAQFVARGHGYSLRLGSEGAVLNLTSARHADSVQMKLAGANSGAVLTATNALPGHSNYLLGNNPANWRHDVPQFARVGYSNVYPGINLVFYGNQGHLEYDFQISPGADPAQAELEFHGASVELQDGNLVLATANGEITLDAPTLYQEVSGRRQPVEGRFERRAANRVGFSVGSYDHSRELVIDPILKFASYFGGAGNEVANQITVDTSGYIYLAAAFSRAR